MSPKKYMSPKNFGGGPERSQRVPPNPQKPNPEGQAGYPNPEQEVTNPEGEVNKGGGISRRDFLKGVVGLGAAALSLGAVGGCAEVIAREDHKRLTYKSLGLENDFERKIFLTEINGVEIYAGIYSIIESGPLIREVINSFLEPMILDLPNSERIGHILMVSKYRTTPDQPHISNDQPPSALLFKSIPYIDMGMIFEISYPAEFEVTKRTVIDALSSKEVRKTLQDEFIGGAVRLSVFGDPNKPSRRLREDELRKCVNSINKHSLECVDLIDLIKPYSERWIEISEQNGGYAKSGYIKIRPLATYEVNPRDLIGYKGFGYIDNPNIRYGREHPFEDVACVFGKIVPPFYRTVRSLYRSSLYSSIGPEEDSRAEISALLRETPDDTGLYEKYLIACESLIGWYEKNSDQYKILTEFIQIIEDAIKEAEGTTNGQSSQTNQGAIKPQKTTGVQETPFEWLMEQLDEIRRLVRKGLS